MLTGKNVYGRFAYTKLSHWKQMIYPFKQIPFQNNKSNETTNKICVKSLIKAPVQRQVRYFGCLIWKFLMLILMMYLSVWHYFYYLFVGKFLHFEKNTSIYRWLHNLNLKQGKPLALYLCDCNVKCWLLSIRY